MALVHVFPHQDTIEHNTDQGASACWCEPRIMDLGVDSAGQPARVFIHQHVQELHAVGHAMAQGNS